jgi:Rhs element Vgr protein
MIYFQKSKKITPLQKILLNGNNMPKERLIPNRAAVDVITFDILSNGQAVSPQYHVLSITVSREANRVPSASIELRDGESASETFPISESADFVPGAELEIKVGYNGENETLFKGIVVRHGIRIRESGVTTLRLECKDKCVKMTAGRKSKYYEDLKDSEIIEQIISATGLQADVETTDLKHKEIVQHDVTDWDFIQMRAELNGKLVIANDGKISVKAPNTGANAALELVFGSTIYEFEAEIDARHQLKAVKAQAWDYASQLLFEASAEPPDFDEPGNLGGSELSDVLGLDEFRLRHSGQVLTQELQAWADACLLKSRLAKIIGRAKFRGFPAILPGVMLQVDGVGERFNGKVFITAARHEIVDGTWFTHAQFGLSPEWFSAKSGICAPSAGGLLPGIEGLQIGKVVALEGDPDGEDRIRVKLPLLDNAAQGTWSRLATLDAGKKRGWVVRPEVDDEVIVGFINGDPRDAVVLGQLHSSKHPAPIPGADVNHHKGYHSRSELKVLFDDENKVIIISTPGGNSIVITEKDKGIIVTDQNNNLLEMKPGGITIKSPKDIKIEATGKIDIKATQDLSLEGLNVKGKANAQLTMEGQAGAKLSTSAIAVVKGSLVQIN